MKKIVVLLSFLLLLLIFAEHAEAKRGKTKTVPRGRVVVVSGKKRGKVGTFSGTVCRNFCFNRIYVLLAEIYCHVKG